MRIYLLLILYNVAKRTKGYVKDSVRSMRDKND